MSFITDFTFARTIIAKLLPMILWVLFTILSRIFLSPAFVDGHQIRVQGVKMMYIVCEQFTQCL